MRDKEGVTPRGGREMVEQRSHARYTLCIKLRTCYGGGGKESERANSGMTPGIFD